MRSFILTIGVTVLGACGGRNAVECEQDSNCDLSGGGMCIAGSTGGHWCAYPDPTCPGGYRWSDQNVGDGLGGQCVPEGPIDAGVDGHVPVDVNPNGAIVSTFQEADVVLGQPDFTSYADNAGGFTVPTAKSLLGPDGVCSAGSLLYVVDAGNDRVLKWNPAPSANYVDAQLILGKSSFTDGQDAVGNTASNLRGTRCAAAGNKLVVADYESRRVLIWNSTASNGQAADLVLGTTSFTSYNGGSTTQSTFKSPYAVWTDGTKLAVADLHRVLLWNTFPTTNGQAADLVIGQPDFTTATALATPTASSLKGASGVFFDGTRLYVGDQLNNRVMIWNSWPTQNGQAADVVLGQPDMTTNTLGMSSTKMQAPEGVLVVDNALFVADMANDRILVFTPIPTTSGAAANYVLGQADVNSGGNNPTAAVNTVDDPVALTLVGKRLYVADKRHNRVIGFPLNIP